jgi:hypothetical protein
MEKKYNNIEENSIWIGKSKEIWPNLTVFLNDRLLKKDNTSQKLKTFFNGCISPLDFHNRIQKYISKSSDSKKNELNWLDFRLPLIVDRVKNYNAKLSCHQQIYLFMAGVKAIFSKYNENLSRFFITKEYGDFKLELWRKFDLTPPLLPYKSHIFLVIDIWNGEENFKINNEIVDKIKIDTWYNEFKEFDKTDEYLKYPNFKPNLNSVIYTKQL